jgi:hypothetical protein
MKINTVCSFDTCDEAYRIAAREYSYGAQCGHRVSEFQIFRSRDCEFRVFEVSFSMLFTE